MTARWTKTELAALARRSIAWMIGGGVAIAGGGAWFAIARSGDGAAHQLAFTAMLAGALTILWHRRKRQQVLDAMTRAE